MESINSNPYFQPSQLAQSYIQPQGPSNAGKASSHVNANQLHPRAVAKAEHGQAISSIFDDSELERLQSNLEGIAKLAEKSLKKIEGGER